MPDGPVPDGDLGLDELDGTFSGAAGQEDPAPGESAGLAAENAAVGDQPTGSADGQIDSGGFAAAAGPAGAIESGEAAGAEELAAPGELCEPNMSPDGQIDPGEFAESRERAGPGGPALPAGLSELNMSPAGHADPDDPGELAAPGRLRPEPNKSSAGHTDPEGLAAPAALSGRVGPAKPGTSADAEPEAGRFGSSGTPADPDGLAALSGRVGPAKPSTSADESEPAAVAGLAESAGLGASDAGALADPLAPTE